MNQMKSSLHRDTGLRALLALTWVPFVRYVQLRMLLAERASERKNRAYFAQMATGAHAGERDCDRRLINIQHQIDQLGDA